jgi:hypothetical protein
MIIGEKTGATGIIHVVLICGKILTKFTRADIVCSQDEVLA